jgi:uncharacterized membrane protein YsdA (DUF1294 family)
MSWLRRRPVLGSLAMILVPALALTAGVWAVLSGEWRAAPWLLSWLAIINAITFVVYGLDKRFAVQETRRVPEATLLTLAFIGGTVGAYAGMRAFRHKTIKGPFRVAFWFLVAVQTVLLIIVAWYACCK